MHDPLDRLADLIREAPLNVVSRRDRDGVRRLHIAESEAVAQALSLPSGARCLDLGSGGGLPGLVVAIVRPDIAVTCLDARAKKVRFIEEAAKALNLRNVEAVSGRAEIIGRDGSLRSSFSCVTCRAVARTSIVAELARAFLAPGGQLAVIKGPAHTDELDGAHRVADPLRYTMPVVAPLPGAPRPTWIVRMTAVGSVPDWVPRMDGVPQNEPLEEIVR